jgi:hypothetical protein
MNVEGWIWLIVIIVALISKGVSALKEAGQGENQPPAPPRLPRKRSARQRPAPARPRPQTARTPPVIAEKKRPSWEVDQRNLEEFIERVTGIQRPPRRPEPEPIVEYVKPPLPEPEPTPNAPSGPPKEPARPTRAAIWAEALRDNSNLRNIVVASEIIGPPKALRS